MGVGGCSLQRAHIPPFLPANYTASETFSEDNLGVLCCRFFVVFHSFLFFSEHFSLTSLNSQLRTLSGTVFFT